VINRLLLLRPVNLLAVGPNSISGLAKKMNAMGDRRMFQSLQREFCVVGRGLFLWRAENMFLFYSVATVKM
jgi:hypothetical protein